MLVRREPMAGPPRRAMHALRAMVVIAIAAVVLVPGLATAALALPTGFEDAVVADGLATPTALSFASDGRIFVAEKRGTVQVLDGADDPTPEVVADLRTEVFNNEDHGLLGLAVHPDFPRDPRIFVLYTVDAAIGGSPPRWGQPDTDVDDCPTPPGADADGCVVSVRLSALTLGGGPVAEDVLRNDWCTQFTTHSAGDVEFGDDGALYVSGGDGAGFRFTDYGQRGFPEPNPCGDPPGGVGAELTPPTAEGGALRSQDLRTPGDPTGLSGTVVRVDPDTGRPLPDNPGAGDAGARSIVAYGLRNPFRFAVRPGADELWIGDVGWRDTEEINRAVPTARVHNFGWPCYEGDIRQSEYDGADLALCEDLYGDGASAHDRPVFSYEHSEEAVAGDGCGTGTSAVSGVSFYPGGDYPSRYDGALFHADFARSCIWVQRLDGQGAPDPARMTPFVTSAGNPVDLAHGPDGDLYYPDIVRGEIRRVSFAPDRPSDIAGTTHERAIAWLVSEGIAFGFDDGTYRPAGPVTRGQMASLLQRALDLPIPDRAPIPLRDIAGTTHEDAITAIAQAGITLGFDDGTYRPARTVTRGQMASFLFRALDGG